MNQPSDGVPPPLLDHVHLVSNYRFPLYPSLSIDDVLQKLIEAPTIVKDHAPMTWTYIDSPADGTVYLVWQPPQLGTFFASDGYVWAEPEAAYPLHSGPCHGEVHVQRSGFSAGRETIAAHSRRRYRLTNTTDPSIVVDPNLWLVHYMASDLNARIPAASIQPTQQIQQMLNTRRHLQSQGQLVRKEFMLSDRSNWPTINIPGSGPPGSRAGPMRPGMPPGPPRGGGRFFPPQHQGMGVGPSPAKRQRQTAGGHGPGPAVLPGPPPVIPGRDPVMDEDEDAYHGDLLDHLTPREISIMRYRQHHEWMEEILSSNYSFSQILPVDLGLGRKGELKQLTDGFFEQPAETVTGELIAGTFKSRSGDLAVIKAEEFKSKSRELEAGAEAEMKKLKARHARRLEKVQRGAALKAAEMELRSAVSDPTVSKTEFWQTDIRGRGTQEEDATEAQAGSNKAVGKFDDIVAAQEKALGKPVAVSRAVREVQKGGYEEPPAAPESPPAEPESSADDGTMMMTDVIADNQQLQAPDKSDMIGDHEMPAFNNGVEKDQGDNDQVMKLDNKSRADIAQTLDTMDEGQFEAMIGDGTEPLVEPEDDGIVDGDIDMHNSAAGLLDQYYTSNPSTPGGGGAGSGVALSTSAAVATAAGGVPAASVPLPPPPQTQSIPNTAVAGSSGDAAHAATPLLESESAPPIATTAPADSLKKPDENDSHSQKNNETAELPPTATETQGLEQTEMEG